MNVMNWISIPLQYGSDVVNEADKSIEDMRLLFNEKSAHITTYLEISKVSV